MGNIVGLDIGYSNLKVTFGDGSGESESAVFPVGVAPLKDFNSSLQAVGGEDIDITKVDVDGEAYAVGFEPSRLRNAPRNISENYTKTKQYKALFLASLLYSDSNYIDKLVTGLPVSHYKDEELKEEIKQMMEGVHQVGEKRSIEVASVSIIPQPGGGFIHALEQASRRGEDKAVRMMKNASCLVIDMGFYSLDFIVFDEGALVTDVSDTSLQATSKIIERAASIISEKVRHAPGKELKPEKIEKAIRESERYIFFNGVEVDVVEVLDIASEEIGDLALSEVTGSLRMHSPDVVVVVGGGAKLLEKSVRKAFSDLEVIIADNHVSAVSKGYYGWGESL